MTDNSYPTLYRIGGAAALIAAIIFRRNLAVEISLFSPQQPPADVIDWFALLQSNRLLGLAYLHVFDLVNYALVALMFLALCVHLRQASKSLAALTAALAFLGVGIYFASNTALSLLALSNQYAAATAAQRAPILAAGQALLALNRFSSAGAHPGSGGYLSLLFVAAAGLIASLVILRARVFPRAAAWTGILANSLDLVYCLIYPFAPNSLSGSLALLFIPAAGFLYLVWHLLLGWNLLRLARREAKTLARQRV